MDSTLLEDTSLLQTPIDFSVEKDIPPPQDVDISSLGLAVKAALHTHLGQDVHRVLFQNNADKYYNANDPLKADNALSEVFHIMRSLNHQAIACSTLGSTPSNSQTFSMALLKTLDTLITHHADRPLQYIELGPEPAKTAFILRYLLAQGFKVQSYTGVDINPASEPEMRSALSDILAPEKIQYCTTEFAKFRTCSIRESGTQILTTMLGFQEGNEDPKTMSGWLGAMLAPNDLLLSEMQLYQKMDTSRITEFYQHPLMKQFSKIAFKRVFGDQNSEYETYILPVTLKDGNDLQAMIMCEAFREGYAQKSLLVTNYCLKYSENEFQHYRAYGSKFRVLSESYTGDKSIVFQLSQRL